MFAFPQEWYREQNINIHLEKPVTRIFPDSQEIEIEG
jgi:NAD(P)H-nitrite reductase large subunit